MVSEPVSIGSSFRGGYEIVALLGAGTFGRVYKARQLSTGQEVALKILHRGDPSADGSAEAERFRHEMRLCGALTHPNIARLVDSGESDDGLLYAMFQYVPGATLREILDDEGKLTLRETAHLMAQVLDALSCAHAAGVVHRDLKPENIIVTKTGARRNAVVLDFGLGAFARDTEAPDYRELVGTACYAAPEQVRGEGASARSDLYSWGLIFIECLTGALAVRGDSAREVLLKQLGSEPVPIPRWLRSQPLGRLLETATAKSVERRTVTVDALLAALRVAELATLATDGRDAPEPLPDKERRQLTILSCRLSIASISAGALDPEEIDQFFQSQHEAISDLVSRGGGHVASVMADRMMLVFGYPYARENDARRAADTALQIVAEVAHASQILEAERRHRLEVRIGIHTGLVIVRERQAGGHHGLHELVGLTPQTALRLEELARAGEVLVSPDTHRLLRNAIGSQAVGTHRLDELSGLVPVFRLTTIPKSHSAQDATQVLRETPLIGRAHQLTRLLQAWAETQEGKTGTVLITGEPGIGKSRLVRELRRRVASNSWLECRCVPENQDSPLRPVVELLTSLPQPIEAVLARYGFDLATSLPLFAALLSIPLDDRYVRLELTPDRQKELTLEALVTLLVRMAQDRPVAFVIEDLHWADPTTLELAALIVREADAPRRLESDAPPRLRAVFTARPAFTPTWSTESTTLIPLSRLAQQEVEAMVAAGLAGGRAVAKGVMDQIVRHADGVPLFIEEVTRIVLESGAGVARLDFAGDDADLEIPSSLRDLLSARLDGMSPGARETAQLAAVLGREFRHELLSALSGNDDATLREDLRELTDAGLVYPRAAGRTESYLFKHALIRDAAYETMTRSRRQRLHARVAAVLRERFLDVEQDQPEIVAQHLERGGAPEIAATYWRRSGDRIMGRGAYVEAIRHLERGIKLLGDAPDRSRVRDELGLIESLGTALLATQGYASPAVESTFARAEHLCQELGEDVPIRVWHGLWGVRMSRAEREPTERWLPVVQRLADGSSDPVVQLTASGAAGHLGFQTGNFVVGRDACAKAMPWYRTDGYRAFVRRYGYDGGLYPFGFHMWSLWVLGHPDRALEACNEMVALAEETANPYGRAIAWGFSANLGHDRGDVEAVQETSERAIAHATEQKLYLWLGPATCSHGWALVQRGAADQGVEEIQRGLGLLRAVGVISTYPYHLGFLAEGLLARGAAEEGLAVTAEALDICRTTLDCFYAAELRRLEGELLRLQGRDDEAEGCFRRALDLARCQQAKSFELRSATSLGRLLRDRGKHGDAHALVKGVYDWFTEGFDTKDLRDARTFLTGVSG